MQSIDVVSIGELLVEVMRTRVDEPLCRPGEFAGPFPSGAPAIFIDAVAKLGRRSAFIGAVGEDDFGDCCTERLASDGVDIAHIRRVSGYTTGTAFVTYFSDGSRKFVFHLRHSAAGQVSLLDGDESLLRRTRFLHICGSSLSMNDEMREACYKALGIVKASGGMVTFDPNLRPELLTIEEVREVCAPVLVKCDILFPSGEEASMLTGIDDPVSACKSFRERGIGIVALKQGSRGSTVFHSGGEIHVPAFEVSPVDPTGAGDCYDAAFVVGILEGWDLERTATFANAVGALATTKLGPMEATPTRQQAMDFMVL